MAIWREKGWSWGSLQSWRPLWDIAGCSIHTQHSSPSLLPTLPPQPRVTSSPPTPSVPTLLHLLTEMSDASDLKGASWLHVLIFEEDGHACHLRQCPALQQRSDSMERLSSDVLHQGSLHSCGTQTTCKGAMLGSDSLTITGKGRARPLVLATPYPTQLPSFKAHGSVCPSLDLSLPI